MDSAYENYKKHQDIILSEEKEIYKMLNIMKDFMTYSYEQKVEAMKKYWGEIAEKKTVYYGNKCKVTIYLDSNKHYHFDFDVSNLDFKYIQEVLPEIATNISNQVAEQAQEKQKSKKLEQENSQVTMSDLDNFLNANTNYSINKIIESSQKKDIKTNEKES